MLAVLGMLLLASASRWQVLLALTARPARTQHSLTAGCAPRAAGARLPLPFKYQTMRATWLGSARTCSRAEACGVHGVPTAVLTVVPCSRMRRDSGRVQRRI